MEIVEDISKRLFLAVREGKLQIARKLIKTYGLSYSKDWLKGYALLTIALRKNHTEVAKLLLVSGSKVNSRSLTKTTPLHFAAINGNIEIAKILLDKGANVNAKDIKENTALYYAIENGDVKLSILLISNGANIKDNPKLLINVVINNSLKMVETLVQYDIDINAVDECERTALHYTVLDDVKRDFRLARATNHFINIKAEIARLLLNKGANVNAKTDRGLTTLHIATEAGFLQVVEVLLEYGADINVCDADGMTALHYTVVNSSLDDCNRYITDPLTDDKIDVKIEIAKLLLSKGANVNAKSKTGLTALQAAAKRGLLEIVEALLEYNVDINVCDVNGITALHYTVGKENPFIDNNHKMCNKIQTEIAKLLIGNGADINAKTTECETALLIAVGNEYIEITDILLKHNANVNCRSSEGLTALHVAAEMGFHEIIDILLDFGADVDSVDNCGRTALYLASVENHDMVVIKLLNHGTKFNVVSAHNDIYLSPDLDEPNFENIDPSDFEDDPDYNPDSRPNFLSEIISDAYRREVIKLAVANLYASKKVVELLSCDDMTEYKAECKIEIANMKCEKFDNSNISLYDILVKDITQLVKYMKNENIVKVLKSKKYETKFPEYGKKITCNFRKAMYRKQLQEKGTEIFLVYFNNTPELPYDCIEEIVNYLKNDDIKALFHACNHNLEIR